MRLDSFLRIVLYQRITCRLQSNCSNKKRKTCARDTDIGYARKLLSLCKRRLDRNVSILDDEFAQEYILSELGERLSLTLLAAASGVDGLYLLGRNLP